MTNDSPKPPEIAKAVTGPPILSYATPARFHSGIRREGNLIVLPDGQDLPELCINCAIDADVRLPITFIFVTQKQVRVCVGLCHRHLRARRVAAWIRSSFFGIPGIAMFLSTCSDRFLYHTISSSDFIGVAIVSGILIGVAVVLLSISDPPVSCSRADQFAIWINGADEPFLRTLPTARLGETPVLRAHNL
jgi:hypothetical protein